MASSIEVKIQGRGSVKDGTTSADAKQVAHCDLCDQDLDAVASTSRDGSGPYACKACLRQRLEAMTIGSYQLRSEGPDAGLPWGKMSG